LDKNFELPITKSYIYRITFNFIIAGLELAKTIVDEVVDEVSWNIQPIELLLLTIFYVPQTQIINRKILHFFSSKLIRPQAEMPITATTSCPLNNNTKRSKMKITGPKFSI
jgi:hypothetical protein